MSSPFSLLCSKAGMGLNARLLYPQSLNFLSSVRPLCLSVYISLPGIYVSTAGLIHLIEGAMPLVMASLKDNTWDARWPAVSLIAEFSNQRKITLLIGMHLFILTLQLASAKLSRLRCPLCWIYSRTRTPWFVWSL